jgi:uncharacterized protein YjiS (DUF1127 family)
MNAHTITAGTHPVLHALIDAVDLMTSPQRWSRGCRDYADVAHLDDHLLTDIGLASEDIIDIRARRPLGVSLASTSGELR